MSASTIEHRPTSSMRPPSQPHGVGMADCAVQVVSPPPAEMLWAISQECGLAEARRRLAWLGVGALLVIHHEHVVGLITGDGIRRARALQATDPRVADAMTDGGRIPLLGWQRVLQLTLSDVLQIFETTRTNHLVVVESEASEFTPVRGLIYRRRVLRQLGVFPVLNRGLELALANVAVRPSSAAGAMGRHP